MFESGQKGGRKGKGGRIGEEKRWEKNDGDTGENEEHTG